jgi:hypothetical protein
MHTSPREVIEARQASKGFNTELASGRRAAAPPSVKMAVREGSLRWESLASRERLRVYFHGRKQGGHGVHGAEKYQERFARCTIVDAEHRHFVSLGYTSSLFSLCWVLSFLIPLKSGRRR